MTDESEALRWIVRLLHDQGVPFQAVGGLAARAYGARRPLVDLDFYVPTRLLDNLAEAASMFVTRPPALHSDESWHLIFMRLEVAGWPIELGGAEGARYFDRQSACWRPAQIDFDASVDMRLHGIAVPVMPVDQLVMYKQRLNRAVDQDDVAAILMGGRGPTG